MFNPVFSQFNSTFSQNASKLGSALDKVNEATKGEADLLQKINELKINKIAKANVEVYDKLKDCTDEIGLISEQLNSSREYLQEIRLLNAKLDDSEQRTRTIEDMAVFFKEERSNLKNMQSFLNQATGEIQVNLQKTLEHLKKTSAEQITELVAHTTEQRQRLQAAIDEQDNVLQQKTSEINRLVSNLGIIEEMVKSLDESTKSQNHNITTLCQDIRKLASQKVSTNAVNFQSEEMPRWAKVMFLTVGSIVSLYGILLIILNLIDIF